MQPDPAADPTRTPEPTDETTDTRLGPTDALASPPSTHVDLHDARYHMLEAELRWMVQMREQVVRNVSHELRTPLTLVLGYLELLDEEELGPLNEAQRRGVSVARRATEQLTRVVDRLLLLQDVNNGELNRMPVESSAWLKQAVDRWRANNLPETATLRLDIPAALPPIVIDPHYLDRVVDNLLANAAKFGPPGGTIGVQARAAENEVQFTVSDQGIGIAAGKLGMVFEQFYQADASVTRPHGGMGVGLAFCRRAVEAHGGRIWAESAGEGQGSTFHVSVPALSV